MVPNCRSGVSLEVIRDHVSTGDHVSVPEVSYDPTTHSITAFASVPESFKQRPLTEVRTILVVTAVSTFRDIQRQIPEASMENFKMTFEYVELTLEGRVQKEFAEFVNGELVLK